MLSPRKVVPLILSTAVLVSLAVVFSGCTSTSISTRLYFMKVKLLEEPNIRYISHEITVNQTSIPPRALLPLPDYYAVGLLGYCEGKSDQKSFSNCSAPSTSFSIDSVNSISSQIGDDNGTPFELAQYIQKGYRTASRWLIVGYITGYITTFLTVAALLAQIPMARTIAIISTVVSSILITATSITMIVIYQLAIIGINSSRQIRAHASFGADTIVSACIAVGFSVSCTLFLFIERCCCCI
ncbi:actin cortical patch SUR7/pH-response regulator pali [Aspergillus ambiguus]|uniref:SUR7/PalI family protein n=1 Tax=Aspergillus ambiguus TaxID=176160 RepID=UPI003CCD96AA